MHIIADMHTHTIASGHAFGSLAENAAAAAARGLAVMAVTDHGPAIPGAPSFLYFRCNSLVPEELCGVRILAGAEVNITDAAGTLDLDDHLRAALDFVLIGLHPYTVYGEGDRATNTAATLAALARPSVDCLAHVANPHFPVDLDAVVAAAARAAVACELNNRSFLTNRGDCRAELHRLLALCRQHEVPVIVTSDAHHQGQIGCFSGSVAALAETRFPEELVLNADRARLEAWLQPRHPKRRPREQVS